jgi:penicillin-binding protein A
MKQPSTTSQLQRLNLAILCGFLLITGSLLMWALYRGPAILSREDNPRLVEAELRILRGKIVDRNEVVLAETVGSGKTLTRLYSLTNSGPAVGYYSFRHGTAGVEEGFDTILSGKNWSESDLFWQQMLHMPREGSDIQISLDAFLQQTADSLMGEYIGAILLLEIGSGNEADILAMVSHPSYDPNLLDAAFDTLVEDERSPLLNRAIQGQYQPGLVLMPMITAVAIERGIISLENIVVNANRPIPIAEQVTDCEVTPPLQTNWSDVLTYRCPGPMVDLGDRLGLPSLTSIFATFSLAETPTLPLNTETVVLEPLADAALAGIGQDNLTVTPLQVALAWAAIIRNGTIPQPVLVTAVQNEHDEWEPVVVEGGGETAVSAQTSRQIRQALPKFEKTTEFSVRVLSGPDKSVNSWYLGAVDNQIIVIVLEDVNELKVIEEMGRSILNVSQNP